jgi:hypothetical protein
MHPVALLALLTIALLAFAVLRLELNFRRAAEAGAGVEPRSADREPSSPEPQTRRPGPELRASPAGGYWQAPFARAA